MSDQRHSQAVILAERARLIMEQGVYHGPTGIDMDLRHVIQASMSATELVTPMEWPAIEHTALVRCQSGTAPARVTITAESTLACVQRKRVTEGISNVAALNFASAISPGGGWLRGAIAQEESLARASTLVKSLTTQMEFYEANRVHGHLFYTDHAIWSPRVPVFADEDGILLPAPYQAFFISMPAPNVGGMVQLTLDEIRALPDLWRDRIRRVLALGIYQQMPHLVLGAWGCGAFGNDPRSVARRFRELLGLSLPWIHGYESITFAILDDSRRRTIYSAFVDSLKDILA